MGPAICAGLVGAGTRGRVHVHEQGGDRRFSSRVRAESQRSTNSGGVDWAAARAGALGCTESVRVVVEGGWGQWDCRSEGTGGIAAARGACQGSEWARGDGAGESL